MTHIPLAHHETASGPTYIYSVRPGDCLSAIIFDIYQGERVSLPDVIAQVQSDNPWITNPDRIHPGELILFRVPFQRLPADACLTYDVRLSRSCWSRQDRETHELGEAATRISALYDQGSRFFQSFSDAATPMLRSGKQHLNRVLNHHAAMSNSEIQRSAYNNLRVASLKAFDRDVGILRQLLWTQPTTRAVQFARGRSRNRTEPVLAQIHRVTKMAAVLKRCGVVLRLLDLGRAVTDDVAASTSTQQLHVRNTTKVVAEMGAAKLAGSLVALGLAKLAIAGTIKLVIIVAVVAVVGAAVNEGIGTLYDMATGTHYEIQTIIDVVELDA